MTSDDGVELGLSLFAPEVDVDTVVADGVGVSEGVAPSTDLVSQVTDFGVQLVAVLADESAPQEIQFQLDIPEGGALVEQVDGSIAVSAPNDVIVFDPADSARFDAQVAEILGDVSNTDAITEGQWAAIDALQPVLGEVTRVNETVATVNPAWAVDANGKPVETRYELDGTVLTQVIVTDENTAFPVVADPSVSFWWKAAKCVGELVLLTAAAVKAVAMVAKLIKFIGGLNKASKVAKAWKSLVGTGSNVDGFKKLVTALGALLKKLANEGWDAMKREASKTAVLTASATILVDAGETLADIIGVKNCVDLALGRY